MALAEVLEPAQPVLRPEVDEFFKFSDEYWLENHDLLLGDVGLVAMLGIDSDNVSFGIEDHSIKAEQVVSLIFDARRREAGTFLWQITFARVGGGRETAQLLSATGFTVGAAQTFDNQGKSGPVRVIDEAATVRLVDEVGRTMQHPATIEKRNRLRSTVVSAREALLGFESGEGAGLSGAIRDRHEKGIKERVSKGSFVPFRPLPLMSPTGTKHS